MKTNFFLSFLACLFLGGAAFQVATSTGRTPSFLMSSADDQQPAFCPGKDGGVNLNRREILSASFAAAVMGVGAGPASAEEGAAAAAGQEKALAQCPCGNCQGETNCVLCCTGVAYYCKFC